ncbi:MAG: CHASE domain-containing protein [Planctomycetota bacterium JB042]
MEREEPPPSPTPSRPSIAPRSTLALLLPIGMAGALLSVATFAILCLRADQRRDAELRLRADAHALLIERFVGNHLMVVRSLQALFEASDEVTPEEFESFARTLRHYTPAASALAWFPRIGAAERSKFEDDLAERDPTLARIWELSEGGVPRPAPPREEYFPAELVHTSRGGSEDLGFDLGSEPQRMEAIHRARDEDEPERLVSTPSLDLQRVGLPPQEGILVLAPVRTGDGVFHGVVGAVLPVAMLVGRALAPMRAAALDVTVFGPAGDGDRVLYRHHAGSDEEAPTEAGAGPAVQHDLRVAERTWRLDFRPSPEMSPARTMPWIILLLGLLLTATVVTYAHALLTRQASVESLAEERAHALVAARERLERAQAERQHAERLLLDAVDRISQGIALFGPDDRILFFNRHYPDAFQLSGSDLLGGTTFEELIREQLARGLIQDAVGREEEWLAWRLERHRHPSEPIEVRRHTGKSYRIVENRLPNGGTFAVVTDITRERKSEEQLRQSQRMEGIGQLTGGVAHDFNNLLTVIMGNLDLVEEGVAGDAELEELARDANRAARRGAELTQRLLAFARRQPLLPAAVDVNRLVERMSSLLQRTIGEQVRLQTSLSKDVWPTLVDAAQLETAILNLAVNARDAMPNGGELVIRTRNVYHDDFATDPDSQGAFVEIEVEDNGSGMSRDVLEHAFEPFFTTKDVGKGSGLGLSMVYGFVRQSGGHVDIHSTPSIGTRVRLFLPRADAVSEPPPPEPAADEEAYRGRGERVVLIEDDAELRDLVDRTLTSLGYVVVAAPDGPEALSITNGEERPDLLLTDVVLPEGMNGIELARAFRERYPDLPVLFISGYSDAEELRESRLGRLLPKPFRREQLAREVREVLDGA